MEVGKVVVKRGEDFFFFFFWFAFHFWKRRKFVLGVPKWEFSTGKKNYTSGKNQENDFAHSEKYVCYVPGCADTLLPVIMSIINNSFRSGSFSRILRQAVVTPLIKKKTISTQIYLKGHWTSLTSIFLYLVL